MKFQDEKAIMKEYVPSLAKWFSKAYGFRYDPLTKLNGPKNIAKLIKNKERGHYKIQKGVYMEDGKVLIMEVKFTIHEKL